MGRNPPAFISISTNPRSPLLKMTILIGSFDWRTVSKSPMSIPKPPSPDIEITCRSGSGELRADGLRHRIGHGPMQE